MDELIATRNYTNTAHHKFRELYSFACEKFTEKFHMKYPKYSFFIGKMKIRYVTNPNNKQKLMGIKTFKPPAIAKY